MIVSASSLTNTQPSRFRESIRPYSQEISSGPIGERRDATVLGSESRADHAYHQRDKNNGFLCTKVHEVPQGTRQTLDLAKHSPVSGNRFKREDSEDIGGFSS